MRRSKKYKKYLNLLSNAKSLDNYLSIVCNNKLYNYDETVELKIAIFRNKKSYTPYRINVVYPNVFGEKVRVLVLAEGENAKIAKEAGADYVGLDDYIQKIQNENWLEFDYMITTPDIMPKIVHLGKILGVKGLMPNPKNGTVTNDILATVKEFKLGKISFREDKNNVIHTKIGKLSQGKDKLHENLKALISSLKEVSHNLSSEIKSIYIKTTMGPSWKVSKSELLSI